jgi:hypothetical protein
MVRVETVWTLLVVPAAAVGFVVRRRWSMPVAVVVWWPYYEL